MGKRIMSLFLAVVMLLSSIPLNAIAAETGATDVQIQNMVSNPEQVPEKETVSGDSTQEPVYSDGGSTDSWYWTLEGTVLTISGSGPMDDYAYATVGPWGKTITEVIIEPGITSIGNHAFYGCNALTKVTMPDSITHIGDMSFAYCSGLTEITIGEGVKSVGDETFYYCSKLATVNFNAVACETMNNYSYDIFYGCNKLTTFIVGEKVTHIPDSIFQNCTTLTTVTLGSSVTSIGNSAFSRCTGLKEITIPQSVTFIGEYAFGYCTGLSEISIPSGVTRMGTGAFAGCTLPTTTYGNAKYLGNAENPYMVLQSATSTSIASIEIHPDTAIILDNAFASCKSLTAVTIPNSVKFIGYRAFYNCSNLASVTLGTGLTAVDKDAFSGCNSALKTYAPSLDAWLQINFGNSYANPAYRKGELYISGEKITNLVIPESVKTIYPYAFYNQKHIEAVTIPNGVTQIGEYAFYSCGFTSVTIPEGVTEIESYVFAYCSKLTDVTFHDGVNAIGQWAFYGCGFASVTIPESVTELPSYAFGNCDSLTEITLPAGLQRIGDYAFTDSALLAAIVLPDGLKAFGKGVFYYCPNMTELVIPDSVTELSEGAFTGMYGLQSLKLPFASVCKPETDTTYKSYYPFGYFFGTSSYNQSVATEQIKNTVYASSGLASSTSTYTYYLPKSLTEVTVTGEEIHMQAFYNCTGLTKVKLPNVKRIGNRAFEKCSNLAELSLSDQVEQLGSNIFTGCSKLSYTIYENGQYLGGAENPHAILVGIVNPAATAIQLHENVKTIASYALANCTGITQITIPDGVIGIGEYAFSGCTKLTSIVIPKSVNSIGRYALRGCSSLQSVTLPVAVPSGGAQFVLFFGTSMDLLPSTLTTVKITSGEIPASAFYGCSQLKTITLFEGVTAIGKEAFRGCTGLTHIGIPGSVKTIGDNAFESCSNATEIYLSEGVESVGASAFLYCSKATRLTLPESLTKIGSYAFQGCTGLTTVTLPSNLQEIGTSIFKGCTNITTMTFGKMDQRLTAYFDTATNTVPVTAVTIKSGIVPANAFNGTTKIATVTLKEGVTAIGPSAFSGCTVMKYIYLPTSITTIGASAFSGCTALQTVSLKDGTKVIGNQAFRGCTALTSISIPDSVTTIEASAFMDCTSLSYHVDGIAKYLGNTDNPKHVLAAITDKTITSFQVSEDTGIILDDVFKSCTKLTTVTIPSTVTSIGSSAFYNCSALTAITIPEGVTTIWSNTFYGCKKLSAITIPASVTEIGLNAFSGCTGLTRVDISDLAAWCNIDFESHPANPVYLAGKLYVGGTLLTKLEVPASVKTLRSSTFAGCTSLTEVIIPDTVETIEGAVFAGCSNLQSMTIPFVGQQKTDTKTYPQYPFGYLFGTTSYTGSTVASQTYYISASTTSSSTYYIPNSLKSLTVTGGNINYGAFFGCVNLTSIDAEAMAAGVADYAFYNCKALTDLKLPSQIETIGAYAFYGCLKLAEITIPDSVTIIGDHAFMNCSALSKVTIGNNVKTIGSYAFSTCTSLTELTIPNSVTTIETGILFKCSGIRSLTIPFVGESRKAATETPQYPLGYLFGTTSYNGGTLTKQYYYNSSTTSTTYSNYYIPTVLKTVTVTDSDLNYGAFYGCANITEIRLGDGVLYVNPDAFIDTNGLEVIEVTENNPNYSSLYRILYNKDQTEIIYIPTKHTYILTVQYFYLTGESAGTTVVQRMKSGVAYNVAIPDILGYSTPLDSVSGTMPMQDLTIDVIYYENSKLTSGQCTDTISWTLYQDGSLVFRGTGDMPDYESGGAPWAAYADQVLAVYIDARITSIGAYAFENCRNMTFIDYGYSVETIGQYAFSGCTSLASFKLPASVTAISQGAFSGCTGLKNVVIPDRITSIADNAFAGCSELIQVTIGGTVTEIGNNTFADCSKLTQVYFRGKPVRLGSNAFGNTGSKFIYYYSSVDGWDDVITDGLWNGYTAIPYNAIAKENFTGTNVYIIKVVDKYNNPLANAVVNLGGNVQSTNADGMVYYLKPAEAQMLSISCPNHITFEDAAFVATTSQVMDIIELSDKPSTVQGVRLDSQSIATSVAVLNCAEDRTVTVTVSGYSKYTIIKYELYQGNRLIATNKTASTSCTFQIAASAFEEGGTVLVRMHTADGNFVSSALNIDVIKLATINEDQIINELSDVNIDIDLGDFGDLEFKIPFSIHGVSGNEDGIYVYTEGRSIYVGINIDVNELFSRKLSKKAIQKKIDQFMEWNGLDGNASRDVEVKFGGYLEIEYLGNNDYYIKSSYVKMGIGLMLESELHASFYGIVGVYFKVKFGAQGQLELHISRFSRESGFEWDDADLSLESMLELEGGAFLLWGMGSAGVFSNLTMGFTIGFIPTTELKAVYITGDMGVRWKLGWGLLSGEKALGPKDIYRWPEEAIALAQQLLAAKQDPNSYTENDRSYLTNRGPWLGGDKEGGILQENIYDGVAPKIVSCGDTAMMVWLDDNSQRDNANFQMLYCSVYQDGAWSEPMAVCDNGTFDCEFDVYTDGEKVYIIYTEMKDTLSSVQSLDITDSASIEAFVTGVEVNVIVYENGVFGTPVRLTNNSICEQLPSITELNGVITATWLESNSLGIGTETSGSSIIHTTLTSDSWSDPIALASNQNAISDIAAIALQGSAYTAYIVDADGDSTTADDQVLVLRYENGDSVQLDTGSIANISSVDIAGIPALTWYNNGNIYMITDALQAPICLMPDGISSGIDYQIVSLSDAQSLLFYTAKNYDQSKNAVDGTDIYGMYIDCDGAISSPVRMTKTQGYVTSYSVYTQNSELFAVFTETFANVSEEDLETVTHFRTAELELCWNIAIEDVQYDITSAKPSSDFNLHFSITNNGTNSVDCLTLNFYDDQGNLLYTVDCDVALESGASTDFKATVVLPQNISAEAYFVEILPQSKMAIVEDAEPENNRVELTLAYTDMSICAEQKIIGEKNYIIFTVTNDGNTASTALLQAFAQNRLISEIETGLIAPGSTEQYIIDIHALTTPEDKILTCNVSSDFTDPFVLNDADSVYLLHIEDSYFTVDPEDAIRNPEISVNVAEFDKFNAKDIALEITAEAEFFDSIEGLKLNEDYFVSQDTITISKTYLATLEVGTHALNFVFDFGDNTTKRSLTVVVSDTTPIALAGSISIAGDVVVGGTVYADISQLTPSTAKVLYTWSVNGEIVSTSNHYVITIQDKGKTLQLTVTAAEGFTGTFTAEAVVTIGQPAAPAAPVISRVESNSITLVQVAGMEYSLDGILWQSSNVFDNLLPNHTYTVYARKMATETSQASAASAGVTVTTQKTTVAAPAVPQLESAENDTIILVPHEGMEYKIEGGQWTDSNIFSGLDTGTTYVFYQRYKETDTAYASEASSASFTTLDVVCGDADGDGYIDAYDASLVMKYSVGAIGDDALNLRALDVDGDGYVDAYDASLIQKFSVGAIEKFPAEE